MSLTLSQTVVLERLQSIALKAKYGFEPSYCDLIEKSGLTTLRARREQRELASPGSATSLLGLGARFRREMLTGKLET